MRFFFVVLFFVFLMSFVSAIKVSPTEVHFEGKAGEKICENVSVFCNGVVFIENRWAVNESRSFSDYKSDSSFFGLDMIYDNNFFVFNYTEKTICVKADKEGFYSGILLLRLKDSNEGVGVWMDVNVSEGEDVFEKISGFIIEERNDSERIIKILFFVSFLLLLFLLRLLIYFKKRA
jgi:hypothetical protein